MVVSVMVMVCAAVMMLPLPSSAFQVMVWVPTANSLPSGLRVMITGSVTKSVAVANPTVTGVVGPVASLVIFSGAVMSGAVVSVMVMVCAAVLNRLLVSVARQVMVVAQRESIGRVVGNVGRVIAGSGDAVVGAAKRRQGGGCLKGVGPPAR